MTRLPIADWWQEAGASGFVPAERYGLISLSLALLAIIALLTWPLPTVSPPGVPAVVAGDAALAETFIDNAPFDPLHRRETSLAPLDAAATPAVAALAEQPLAIGGILLAGSERRVMFNIAPGTWYREGDTIRNWLIRHIEPETVILTEGSQITTLTYREALETLNGAAAGTQP